MFQADVACTLAKCHWEAKLGSFGVKVPRATLSRSTKVKRPVFSRAALTLSIACAGTWRIFILSEGICAVVEAPCALIAANIAASFAPCRDFMISRSIGGGVFRGWPNATVHRSSKAIVIRFILCPELG